MLLHFLYINILYTLILVFAEEFDEALHTHIYGHVINTLPEINKHMFIFVGFPPKCVLQKYDFLWDIKSRES